MADILGAELLKPDEVGPGTLSEYDLIGFGSGIYFSKHHRALFTLVDKLPLSENRKAFIFSTRGIGPVGFYHRPLRKRLLSKGYKIVGEFSCRGFDTVGLYRLIGGQNKGRPNEKDIGDAENFAANVGGIS